MNPEDISVWGGKQDTGKLDKACDAAEAAGCIEQPVPVVEAEFGLKVVTDEGRYLVSAAIACEITPIPVVVLETADLLVLGQTALADNKKIITERVLHQLLEGNSMKAAMTALWG